MAGQDWLILSINGELSDEWKKYGLHMYNSYEKFCGKLRLEDIFTTDSVYLSAKRCASGFMKKNDTWYYQQNSWINSRKLCQKVLMGTFKPKYYRQRVINERGKQRIIKPPVFECKIVQKVLCDYIIRPLLEPRMIQTNYASVKGRGTKKLYEDILQSLNRLLGKSEKYYVIKSDYSNYFGNIDTEVLIYDILARYLKDERLLELFHLFSPDELGLSLGNEVSQIPASYFPSEFDHYCKDRKGWSYFRYMDDSLVILQESEIREYEIALERYTKRLHITLKEDKKEIFPLGTSFIFCKERFLIDKENGNYYRFMNPAIMRNEVRKLKIFQKKLSGGEMTKEAIDLQYRGVLGSIAGHPNTYHARKLLNDLYEAISRKEAEKV